MNMVRMAVVAVLLVLSACGGGSSDEVGGADLFTGAGCAACHTATDTARGPTLEGLWGSEVMLEDGRSVTVDEAYVRRSITSPGADIRVGFDTRMPPVSLSQSEVDRLVEYVRDLG